MLAMEKVESCHMENGRQSVEAEVTERSARLSIRMRGPSSPVRGHPFFLFVEEKPLKARPDFEAERTVVWINQE